jgi:glutaminase
MLDAAAIKNSYLVAGLTDEQISQIAAIGTIRTYSSGRPLVETGDQPGELFAILSGDVRVTTDDGDLLGEVGPNSLIGEVGLVDGGTATGNAICSGMVTVAAFPIVELRRLMVQNRDWGFTVLANISRLLANRLRRLNTRVDELSDQATQPWDQFVG